MATIDNELAAFETLKPELEAHQMGKWVLIYGGQLIAVHETFESAAIDASAKFGRGPYLIRQVGAPPVTLPASVAYFQYTNAHS